jgi:NAD(P)-dependent dehydrogenase (short-subunit alcohol dehydrogenase family)
MGTGRLAGRTAVVTGGASGIGRAVALRFADEGAFVVVGDVRADPAEGGEPVAALLGDRGLFLEADAARGDGVDRLVGAAVERGGRLDVMVCNAGIAGARSKGLLETTEEDWDAIMAVNLRGVFLGCKRAIAEMLGQEPVDEARGRVVVVSSQHGLVGPPGHVAYAASKGGVVNLVHQLAVDRGCGPSCSSTRARARPSTGSGCRRTSPPPRSSSRRATPATSAASTCSSTAAGWPTDGSQSLSA